MPESKKDRILRGVFLNDDRKLLQEALRGTVEALATLEQQRSPWVKNVTRTAFTRLEHLMVSDPQDVRYGWVPVALPPTPKSTGRA